MFTSFTHNTQSAPAQQKSHPISPSFRIGQQPTTTGNNSTADSQFPRCANPQPDRTKHNRATTKRTHFSTKFGIRISSLIRVSDFGFFHPSRFPLSYCQPTTNNCISSAQQKSRPNPPSFRIVLQNVTSCYTSIADSPFSRCANAQPQRNRKITAHFAASRQSVIIPLMQPLGLIAGEGVFPILVARGARAAGRQVVCAALARSAWPDLRDEVDHFEWVGLLRIGRWIRVLKAAGCSEAIMVGRVAKSQMYNRWRYFQYIPDWRMIRLWFTALRRDKRPAAVLQSLINELQSEGIRLIDSTQYCSEHLATPGVMTRRHPTEAQWEDIRHGWEICSTLCQLDVGQAMAVLDRDVIAVEALEGTNAMIERAGQLCKVGGWTMIKVANRTQDMRLDVPTIGTQTIEQLHAARAACVVLESGKTIILEKTKVLELADRYKIAVVGYEGNSQKAEQ
jgi:hypothetical protein